MRSRFKSPDYESTCFITSTIVDWIPVFKEKKYLEILIESIKYNQSNKDLKVFAYVILDNHFHMICRSEKISNVIRSIKSYSAKKIIEQLKCEGKYSLLKKFEEKKRKDKDTCKYQIWQEGFMPKEIADEKMFYQKMHYVHLNPVKAGIVENPQDYAYSSAYDFYWGKVGKIKLDYFEYEN